MSNQPSPTGNGDIVVMNVLKHFADRAQFGMEKYGTMLRTHNGRRGLADLMDELSDGMMYIMQLQMEGGLEARIMELESENKSLKARLETKEEVQSGKMIESILRSSITAVSKERDSHRERANAAEAKARKLENELKRLRREFEIATKVNWLSPDEFPTHDIHHSVPIIILTVDGNMTQGYFRLDAVSDDAPWGLAQSSVCKWVPSGDVKGWCYPQDLPVLTDGKHDTV